MSPGVTAFVVSIISVAIAGLIVLLRCIARFVIIRKAGIDDIFVILGYICSLTVACLTYSQLQHGLGKDIKEMNYADLFALMKYQWTTIIIYGLAMTFIALSTLSQYLRFLFRREYRILCWVLIAINASFGIVALFVDIFTCRPISYFYNKFTPGKCINMTAWWYFATVYIAIMCVIVVIIPIIALKDLQLPRSQKRALIGVFALGGLSCIMSCLGLYAIHLVVNSRNYPRDSAVHVCWESLEMNLAIVCISLPSLKALSAHAIPSAKLSRDESKFSHLGSSHSNMAHLQQTKSNRTEITVQRIEPDPYEIP